MRARPRSPTFRPAYHGSSRRLGFSLVEVLVALMLVSIGLLGMAGTSALALRSTRASAGERDAARRIMARRADLAAGGCARAGNGMRTTLQGTREEWTIAPAGTGAVSVTTTVRWDSGFGPRTLTVRDALLC